MLLLLWYDVAVLETREELCACTLNYANACAALGHPPWCRPSEGILPNVVELDRLNSKRPTRPNDFIPWHSLAESQHQHPSLLLLNQPTSTYICTSSRPRTKQLQLLDFISFLRRVSALGIIVKGMRFSRVVQSTGQGAQDSNGGRLQNWELHLHPITHPLDA